MTGMTASSASLSAVSCDASLVKTVLVSYTVIWLAWVFPTEAWSEQNNVEVGSEFLHLCIEHALAGDNVSWKADTNDLHYGFKDKEDQVAQWRVRSMWSRCLVGKSRKRALHTECQW